MHQPAPPFPYSGKLETVRTVCLLPVKVVALAAFAYAFGGWLLLPPSAILGGIL